MHQLYFQGKSQKNETQILRQAVRMIRAGKEWEPLLRKELVADLNLEFEKYVYQKKLIGFRKSLKRYTNDIENYAENLDRKHVFTFHDSRGEECSISIPFVTESYNSLLKKQATLQALINAALQFIETGDRIYKEHICLLESYLWPMEAVCQWLFDIKPQVKADISLAALKDQFIAKWIRRKIGKIIFRIAYDLRFHFRTIIKFLFKNMDDESGDTVLLEPTANKTIPHNNLSLHGKYTIGRILTRVA